MDKTKEMKKLICTCNK